MRFAREGYRGSSVADVCRDAGLSTTASYPYFANKEALFVAAVDEDVAGLIDDAVSLVLLDTQGNQWGQLMMRALVAHMDEHPLAGRILRGLEPEFTMRLLHIPALQQLRKTVAELIRDQQLAGEVRRDIEPGETASGMVVIIISLLMATMQTGASAGGDRAGGGRRGVGPAGGDPAPDLTAQRSVSAGVFPRALRVDHGVLAATVSARRDDVDASPRPPRPPCRRRPSPTPPRCLTATARPAASWSP